MQKPPNSEKSGLQFGSVPPYSLVEVPPWPPALKEDHVTGPRDCSNECNSVISARFGLSLSTILQYVGQRGR